MTPTDPAGYHPEPGSFDELLDTEGRPRGHWRRLAADLAALGPGELARRAAAGDRLLVTEGAGHVGPGEEGTARRWRLDPVPLVLGAAEWRRLAAGLAQRARVLEAVLADLLGAQRLLTEGIVPAAAVVGWPGYQRAARALRTGGCRVVLYGPDLVRTADGTMAVLADHTDVPTGAGLALLQRSISTRLLPELHRRSSVAALADLSPALRTALAAHAPAERRNPRLLVHTPGPGHPAYLDHSYLAAELGYHAVTGEDLAVRGGRLWLRSLGELEPVDAVLRRVPDRWVDPLEAAPGGPGGVPGLFQAAREGGVGVANAPGSALAGHLALLPFLPAAARSLLDEELALGSVDTWWCGLDEHREEVLGGLDQLVLHDVGGGPGALRSAFGAELDEAGRHEWARLLGDEPGRVVAQRRVRLATTPGFADGALRPRSVVLRAIVVQGPDGPFVLPGGHARVIDPAAPALVQASGWAKDVWVRTNGRAVEVVVAVPAVDVPQIDLRTSLPSRAGEALFWMGRNAERAETAVRVVQVLLRRIEQDPDLQLEADGAWLRRTLAGLRAVSGAIGRPPADPPGGTGAPAAAGEAPDLPWDEIAGALDGRAGAAAAAVVHLVAGARTIREHVSTSTWRILEMLDQERMGLEAAVAARDPLALGEALDRTMVPLVAFAGLAKESMVRGPGWRMLDIGRRLDRALLLLGLVEATVLPPTPPELHQPLHETVLTACESLVAYRRRFRSDVTLAGVAEMLLADATNPRSLAFQLDQLDEDIAGLPDGPAARSQRATVARARRMITDAPWAGTFGSTEGLAEQLQSLVLGVRPILLDLAAAVVGTWFAHLPHARRGGG